MGAGVGAMEANTWCTRSHDGHWGWVGGGGRGPGMAMWGGEERAAGPSQELLEVVGWGVGWGWAASLVAEDGRNQLEGVEWRHGRHGHMADGLGPRNGV